MKFLFVICTFILSFNVCAQKAFILPNTFIRLYNLEGEKIGKGKVQSITDEAIMLKRGQIIQEYFVRDVGYIKTKRTGGHNVLVGAGTGAITLSFILLASAEPGKIGAPQSEGDAVASGVLFGGFLGAIIGSISILFKNSKTIMINGDLQKWNEIMIPAEG